MIALRTVALVVRFLLELGLLIGAGTIALALLPPSIGWIVGLAAVGAVATVWGVFVAPRSPVRMHWAGRLAIETSLFAAIAAGLWIIGRPDIAIAGFAVWLAHRVVLGAVRVPSPLDYVPPGTRAQR